MQCGQEISRFPVKASGDPSELLELSEGSFNAVSLSVEAAVVFSLDLSSGGGRNHGYGTQFLNPAQNLITVVCLIGNDGFGVHPFEQWQCLRTVVDLSAGQNKSQRTTRTICQEMNFSSQASSGTPQSLVLAPPVPLIAIW
jgi:hypothetical protein